MTLTAELAAVPNRAPAFAGVVRCLPRLTGFSAANDRKVASGQSTTHRIRLIAVPSNRRHGDPIER
jgi:hypothetical protein